MAVFKNLEFSKHNHKYAFMLIEKIENGEPVRLGDNGEKGEFVIDKNCEYLKLFKKSAKTGISGSSANPPIPINKEYFLAKSKQTRKQTIIKFTDIFKGDFSGAKSKSDKGQSYNTDDKREVSAAIVAFAMATRGKNIMKEEEIFSFIRDFNKLPSSIKSRFSCKLPVEETLKYMLEKHNENFIPAYNCGKKIVDVFGIQKLKTWTFHHKDNFFDTVKERGYNITKFGTTNGDKWNPSDIILTKEHSPLIPNTDDILDFNDWFTNDDKILGISLKVSYEGALHGASGFDAIGDYVGSSVRSGDKTGLLFEQKDCIKNLSKWFIDRLKPLVSSKKIILVLPSGTKNISDAVVSMTHLDNISNNYFEGVPRTIDFIEKIVKDINENTIDDKLEKLARVSYIICSSTTPFSCPYHKIMGNQYHYMSYEGAQKENFVFNKLYVFINGSTQCIFDIIVDNKPVKLQIRSKGAAPQFMIVPVGELYSAQKGDDFVSISSSALK